MQWAFNGIFNGISIEILMDFFLWNLYWNFYRFLCGIFNGFLKILKPIIQGLIAIPIPLEKNSFNTEVIIKKYALDIPIISVLEGGYDMKGLYNSLNNHLKVLQKYSNE